MWSALCPVDEQSVSEPCANREYSPLLHILHGWHLAQPLHYSIVMHDNRGFEFADRGDRFYETGGQIKARTFPVAGEVLSATVNRPIRLDLAGAANTDEGRKIQLFLFSGADQFSYAGPRADLRHPQRHLQRTERSR